MTFITLNNQRKFQRKQFYLNIRNTTINVNYLK